MGPIFFPFHHIPLKPQVTASHRFAVPGSWLPCLPCVLLHLGPACWSRLTPRLHYSGAHEDGASVAWLLGWGMLGGVEAGTALPQLRELLGRPRVALTVPICEPALSLLPFFPFLLLPTLPLETVPGASTNTRGISQHTQLALTIALQVTEHDPSAQPSWEPAGRSGSASWRRSEGRGSSTGGHGSKVPPLRRPGHRKCCRTRISLSKSQGGM